MEVNLFIGQDNLYEDSGNREAAIESRPLQLHSSFWNNFDTSWVEDKLYAVIL